MSAVLSDISLTDRRAPGMEKRVQEQRMYQGINEYEQKRVSGVRAMLTKPNGNYRVPTNIWSGYGISHTSPGAFADKRQRGREEVRF